jgi:hypothetical protein
MVVFTYGVTKRKKQSKSIGTFMKAGYVLLTALSRQIFLQVEAQIKL